MAKYRVSTRRLRESMDILLYILRESDCVDYFAFERLRMDSNCNWYVDIKLTPEFALLVQLKYNCSIVKQPGVLELCVNTIGKVINHFRKMRGN